MKDTVLGFLEANKDTYISGEQIAKELGMTRANIWKEIQKLKNLGINISSTRNLGYKLENYNGNFSSSLLTVALPQLSKIDIYESITSTNDIAKINITNNRLVIANHQTSGRGRFGRSFYSPNKSGVYMTLTLFPKLELNDVQLVTICAALAVCFALESLYNLEPKIKWLNDIYLDNRKLCGILTEGEIELETNSFRHVILGIGINTVLTDSIPEDIQSIYTALSQHLDVEIDRNQLIIAIINNFYILYNDLPLNRYKLISMYKQRSNVIGKLITIKGKSNETYLVQDISSNAHLIVVDEQQNRLELNSGEISIGAIFDED